MTCYTSAKVEGRASENPVLWGFRSADVSIADAFAAMELAEAWNQNEDPNYRDPEWTNDHIRHAREVLSRLAVLRGEALPAEVAA